jgi:CRP/FNR family transcriptional regulator
MSARKESGNILIEQLKVIPFFSDLDIDTLEHLRQQARHRVYEPGQAVFVEGDPSQGLFWLHSGMLKAAKYSISGREQVLHLIRPGQTFNEVGAFTDLPNPASVMVLEQSSVWHLPRRAIKALMLQEPVFAQQVIDVLTQRLRHSVALVEDLSMRPVTSRLARLILDEAVDDTLRRPRWYTQNELAARLGTVTDVVQRSLQKLEEDGLIEVERQQIRILRRDDLAALAT